MSQSSTNLNQFSWGHHGSETKIDPMNQYKAVMMEENWSSIYTSEAFNAKECETATFTIKLEQEAENSGPLIIGIINNTDCDGNWSTSTNGVYLGIDCCAPTIEKYSSFRVITITFVPSNVMNYFGIGQKGSTSILNEIPNTYHVTIARNSTIGDLKSELGEMVGVEPDRLVLVDMWHDKVYAWFKDGDESSDIRDSDTIYAYEVPTRNDIIASNKFDEIKDNTEFRLCCVQHKLLRLFGASWSRKEWCTEDTGIPLVIRLPIEHEMNSQTLYEMVTRMIEPYFIKDNFDKFETSETDILREKHRISVLEEKNDDDDDIDEDVIVKNIMPNDINDGIIDPNSLDPYSIIVLNRHGNSCAWCGMMSDCDGCNLTDSFCVVMPEREWDSINIGVEWKTNALNCFNHGVFLREDNQTSMNIYDDSMSRCENGDIVTFVVDFGNRKIVVEKNSSGERFTIFENINEKALYNHNFRFSVCCTGKNRSIQLISSKTTKHIATFVNEMKQQINNSNLKAIQSSMQRYSSMNKETNGNWVDDCLSLGAQLISIAAMQMQENIKHLSISDTSVSTLTSSINISDPHHDADCKENDKNPDVNGVNDDNDTSESIEHWMNKTNEMTNIDFKNLIEDYPKSVEIANKQRERQAKMSEQYIIPALQMKTTGNESLGKLTAEMKREQVEMEQIRLKLTNVNDIISGLQTEINKNINKMIESAKCFGELQQNVKNKQEKLNKLHSDITRQTSMINNCDVLSILTQCNQFSRDTSKYTQEMESRRRQALNLFESKWFEWDYNDIIFWFKVKLGYFDAKNDSNGDENNNDHDQKRNDSELLSIDFENIIYNNLESQKVRGKFLSSINRGDLRNLGFELFEHQCVLRKAIEILVQKYPIDSRRR